jgi:hypothetical protein
MCAACGQVGGRLLSITAVARELGVCHKTARNYLRRHAVPIVVLGVIHKRVDRRDLERMIEAMKARGDAALRAMTDRRRATAAFHGARA